MFPEKIGRYEIKSELGRGGFATVYRAYDPRFEREVAIKFLPPELIHSDPQFRLRFEREAKIIAQLEHPSIVPVYDVGEENNQPYFVMRYMNGGALSERIREHTFSIEEAVKVIESIAPGLDEAHSKGIVHRDLKPANILFTNKNTPLISDFGIAKFSQGEASNVTGSAIIGTPAYMAPEQASGEGIDGRADIYALGVILYEMLIGKQPYKADTPLGLALKHITEPVPRILEANPNLPNWMEKVISTAMAKDPDDRFSTAMELVETIKAFMRGEKPPERKSNATLKASPFNRTTIARRQKNQSNPVPAILIGLFLVILIGGGGYFFFAGGNLPFVAVVPTVTTISEPPTATAFAVVNATELQDITETPALPTNTAEPAAPSLPVLGGADKIAFLRNNDIYIMNVDGSDLKQVTTDGVAKFNLQWLPDGNTILYLTGKTAKIVDIESLREDIIVNFLSAEYFESFSVSPDGTQVALALNRELYVVPFDIEKLKTVNKKSALLDMKGCLFFDELAVKEAAWSDDGTRLAIKYLANSNGSFADTIRIMDITQCDKAEPTRIDDFPGPWFKFNNEIINFDYDGDMVFFINSGVRNGGFGDLVFYNAFTHKFEKAAPYEGNCCYRDAAFSPDGSYVILAFQDIRLGTESPINLYYIPSDSISTQRALEPLPLPEGFFTKRNDAPMPVLRPAKP